MDVKKISKRLSYVLRHAPEKANLTLDIGGWVQISDLLKGLKESGGAISRDQLDYVVANNDKKRFTISDDGLKIRAAQGHSVKIVNDLMPITPPEKLYHGTATRFLDKILADGLKPMSRQHVHLSADIETAVKVGQRHGKPIILNIASAQMAADGHKFYQADNGVWLTGAVPPQYLSSSR